MIIFFINPIITLLPNLSSVIIPNDYPIIYIPFKNIIGVVLTKLLGSIIVVLKKSNWIITNYN